MLEKVRCNLCKGDNYRVIYRSTIENGRPLRPEDLSTEYADIGTHRIVKCRRCGLVYANPRDRVQDIMEGYRKVVDRTYLGEGKDKLVGFKGRLRGVERFKTEGSLLDIGCSYGFFLEVAGQRFQTYGVELSQFAAGYGRKQLGLNVFDGDLDKAGFQGNSFDVVTMWDVIEHLPDPLHTLIEVKRILKKGGIVCISTPDIGSILARFLRRRWFPIARLHLYYFSQETLAKLLEKAGLELTAVTGSAGYYSLGYLVKRLRPYNKFAHDTLTHLVERVPKLKDVSLKINLGDCLVVYGRKS